MNPGRASSAAVSGLTEAAFSTKPVSWSAG